MRILVTSGGTSEKIDEVRKITNTSTGKLAKEIIKAFQDSFDDIIIDLISTKKAVKPTNVNLFLIENVKDLQHAMLDCLENNTYDVIIHCMAVSDYAVTKVYNEQKLIEDIYEQLKGKTIDDPTIIKKSIENVSFLDNSKKLSSDIEAMYVKLEKTPKIISLIRKNAANSIIFGFKLLENVSDEELITVAKKQIKTNDTDFCVANDQVNINNEQHKAIIISKENNIVASANTKQEVASAIVDIVINKLEN
ncbi:phosphopantothenoylcysteine decarboxylase [Mycoplasma sp. P36-A1]|uniref:phosphopantothenoylcysteine decarboxylase domain-containing protein n=1 Tax=Mycoplasma sp. P36-A1 TaxID=3252900 RepID=UPI003C304FDD